MLLYRYSANISTLCSRYGKKGYRSFVTKPNISNITNETEILGKKYQTDDWTNVTKQICSKLGKNLHTTKYHPLSHVRQRIVNYFHKNYCNRHGNPLFTVIDNLCPVVTTQQNFDSLLIPQDHPSRCKSDCYYINQDTLLRGHMTAHQAELISMGLNNFLIIGDVYRRDEIDVKHYPVFHQVDAVRLYALEDVFQNVKDINSVSLFERNGASNENKQACHTLSATEIMENQLKHALVGLAQTLFGAGVQYRWVEQYFPFTHPSWELEIYHKDNWYEILGCGIIRQQILNNTGVADRIGWAFGLGLERIAMCLYDIPDIRLFWSNDNGVLLQFRVEDPNTNIQYKAVSVHPTCKNDLSFWLPENGNYASNDFYDIAREIGGDMVESIELIDNFTHPKTKRTSHCYTIVYRHMDRPLTKDEVNSVHEQIAHTVAKRLNVTPRR